MGQKSSLSINAAPGTAPKRQLSTQSWSCRENTMLKRAFCIFLVVSAMFAISMASFDDDDENPSSRVKSVLFSPSFQRLWLDHTLNDETMHIILNSFSLHPLYLAVFLRVCLRWMSRKKNGPVVLSDSLWTKKRARFASHSALWEYESNSTCLSLAGWAGRLSVIGTTINNTSASVMHVATGRYFRAS